MPHRAFEPNSWGLLYQIFNNSAVQVCLYDKYSRVTRNERTLLTATLCCEASLDPARDALWRQLSDI
jgi:hypothetical protein